VPLPLLRVGSAGGESVGWEKKEDVKGGVIGIIQVELVYGGRYPHPVRGRDPGVLMDASRSPSESFHTALDTWYCLAFRQMTINFINI
jgi:hypothetical protein